VLTVVSWFAARKSRRPIVQLVADNLRPEPTLLALLADRYTSESSLRPFAPLAEKLGDRMHVLVLAEWPQPDRERDGEALLRSLGVSREAWPMLLRDENDARFAVVLHRGDHVTEAEQRLRDLLQDLLAEAARSGDVRDDIPPGELAGYCLSALAAAGGLPSTAAVRRLVTVTLAGLHSCAGPHAERHGG